MAGEISGLSPVAELGAQRETRGCGVVVERPKDEMLTLKYFRRQFRRRISTQDRDFGSRC